MKNCLFFCCLFYLFRKLINLFSQQLLSKQLFSQKLFSFSQRYTQRNGYVYAIVLNWPSNSNLKLGAVNPGQVNSIQMLGLDGNLSFSPITSGGTTVSLPSVTPNSGLQWAWVLKITQKQQP